MKGHKMSRFKYIIGRKTTAHILTFMLMVTMLGGLLFPEIIASAENKVYSVPAAHFYVKIEDDGRVSVTDVWDVKFSEGTFSRFYKDIYKNVPAEEAFSLDEDSVKVSIDGRSCLREKNSKDYTFRLTDNGEYYTVSCYRQSEGVKRAYKISYIINNAVKIVDNEYYLVTFRMIGAHFSKTVGHVEARFTAPQGAVMDVRNGKYFDIVSVKGNQAN